jgi:hypothetical protein
MMFVIISLLLTLQYSNLCFSFLISPRINLLTVVTWHKSLAIDSEKINTWYYLLKQERRIQSDFRKECRRAFKREQLIETDRDALWYLIMLFWFVTRCFLGTLTVEQHAARKHIAHRATHINIQNDNTEEQKSVCEVTVLSSCLRVPISYFSLSLVWKLEDTPTSYFFNFLKSLITTWQRRKIVVRRQH